MFIVIREAGQAISCLARLVPPPTLVKLPRYFACTRTTQHPHNGSVAACFSFRAPSLTDLRTS